MTFRDDADALATRSLALQREVDRLRDEVGRRDKMIAELQQPRQAPPRVSTAELDRRAAELKLVEPPLPSSPELAAKLREGDGHDALRELRAGFAVPPMPAPADVPVIRPAPSPQQALVRREQALPSHIVRAAPPARWQPVPLFIGVTIGSVLTTVGWLIALL